MSVEAPPAAPSRRAVDGPYPRDFEEKVAGALRYADDWALPGMLHGAVVRSTLPSARIVSIDTAAARAVPGVRAVLTAQDVPHNVISEEASGLGLDPVIMPALADDRVRYDGEPVAVVAADTQWAAEEAAALVDVDYEDLPGVFTIEDALAAGAPVVHEHGNRYVAWHLAEGDVERAFADADVVVEATYRTQHVDHAYLEPEAGIAWIDGDGVLVLRVSTQVIEHARTVADMLRLPHSRVRVIGTYMGGGFGGKEDMTVEPYLALLAWKTKRPVRMVWTRQESLLARQKRHPFTMRYRTGATRDGRITGQEISILGNAGAYPLLSTRVLFAAAVNSTGPYRFDAARVDSVAVFTNTVPTSAFRGFGAMQVVFAYEQQMDRVAEALGMDPVALRERNFVQQGDRRVTGETIDTGVGVGECLRTAVEALGAPTPAAPGKRVGIGFGCSMQPYGRSVFFADRASCWLGLEQDGTLVIRAGVTDLGAGQAASLSQIACETLGMTIDRASIHIADSHLTPLVGGTFATRQLYMSGNATLKVARELKDKLSPVAASLLGVGVDELEWADNQVRVAGRPEHAITMAELSCDAENRSVMPYCHSTFNAEVGEFDPTTGRGRSFPDYTYGAHGAEVEVDEETGQVRILRYVACHDVGRAIHLQRVEGQIEGAVAQGIGYALSEEVEIEDGTCVSSLFADYLIPSSLDVPDIKAIVLQIHPGKGPLGARGIGEPPIGPPAPALAAAIHNATGVWMTRLPMTPERILSAMRGPVA
ncbi:MAG TPA: xanthine dehydrogenase family protein molybdopterin-binding subunit [Solirubrobacter sp.]|nr:xanthine dehydrogenase family protein molybdopterin-binding subunit [Solirubrobacter sp.]